jgi:uncharacterized protein YeaO (DUF488 family)
MNQLKRAFDDRTESEGIQILVDRIWPRGKSKADLELEDWIRELAPSTELRQWFNYDSGKWDEFYSGYWEELREKTYLWEPLLEKAEQGTMTLIFSAKDQEHNNAVVLRDFLEQEMK